MAELLALRGMSRDEAARRVLDAEAGAVPMAGGVWPFGADRSVGIAPGELAAHVVDTFRQRYAMHPDARSFMLGLRTLRGIRVYPATTNPRLFILGKLASGGLADATGTQVFDDCFGGEEVSAGGKCGPGFYHALCARTGTRPSDCVMVGDEVLPDLTYAREAGIRHVFIVSRQESERRRETGGSFINTLETAGFAIRALVATRPDSTTRASPRVSAPR